MPLGDGIGWDTIAPADTDPRKDGAAEIRDLRKGVGIRVDKEHESLASASAGGEHRPGSAKAYFDISSAFPSTRPNSDAFTNDDKGRLALVDGTLYVYTGTTDDWGNRAGDIVLSAADTYAAFVDVGMPFQSLMFYAYTGAVIGGGSWVCCPKIGLDEALVIYGVTSLGAANTLVVDCEQASAPYRFRIKNTAGSGTIRYRVIL